jgi:hypothetical protein
MRHLGDTMETRKYSRKGISSKPKTFRQYKSAVNKVLWRKYHLRRDDLGVTVDAIKSAFAEGKLTADQFVASVVNA